MLRIPLFHSLEVSGILTFKHKMKLLLLKKGLFCATSGCGGICRCGIAIIK